jgi:hypothetical protein
VVALAPEDAAEHFGWLGGLLIADIDQGHYYRGHAARVG